MLSREGGAFRAEGTSRARLPWEESDLHAPRSPPRPCAFCHLCPLTSSVPCGLVLGLMSLVFSATLATKASTLLQPELCQPPPLLPRPPPRWLALFLSWALPPKHAVQHRVLRSETSVCKSGNACEMAPLTGGRLPLSLLRYSPFARPSATSHPSSQSLGCGTPSPDSGHTLSENKMQALSSFSKLAFKLILWVDKS